MRYAIIAAGEGSRLQQEGIATPKPLIRINGVPLIERHILRAIEFGFSEVCVIINQLHPETAEWFARHTFDIPIRLIRKTTPGSLHSFFELGTLLSGQDFLLTTVDPVFPDSAFEAFLSAVKTHSGAHGVMAVTGFVDDESPLWVKVSNHGQITGYSNQKGNTHLASAGFYYFRPEILPILEEAFRAGTNRMRDFQQYLVNKDFILMVVDVGKVIDLDHKQDIIAAEILMREHRQNSSGFEA